MTPINAEKREKNAEAPARDVMVPASFARYATGRVCSIGTASKNEWMVSESATSNRVTIDRNEAVVKQKDRNKYITVRGCVCKRE